MLKPYLVQRCYFGSDGQLTYEYMGSSEYEMGSRSHSLKRIFTAGIATAVATVQMDEKEFHVYMVAGRDFDFNEYQPYLTQLADGSIRLKESSEFGPAIEAHLGTPKKEKRPSFQTHTNVWFDIDNDVLWTLTEDLRTKLLIELERIRTKWSEKEKVKT